jgi:thioredoxin reductase
MSSKRERKYEYIVVGAGPAGLQIGYFLQKKKEDYLIIEKASSPGEFFKLFPRHRKLISINKVYTGVNNSETNLRWDWNSLLCDSEEMLFTKYTQDYFPNADSLVEYLQDFADHYKLNIQYNTNLCKFSRYGDFILEDNSGNIYKAEKLIIAAGKTKPYIPDIPGIEFAETYSEMSINPEQFTNQRVMVIGKGNSGLETADNLIEKAATIHLLSRQPLRLAWRTHYVGDLRAVNNNFLDTYRLKSQNTVIDAEIESIEKLVDGKLSVKFNYSHAEGEQFTLTLDHILLCTGFKFDYSYFDQQTCMPELTDCGRFPKLTSEWESVNIKDLYFAGALMHGRDYRKSFSGFIHGFRYNIECLSRILDYKYKGKEFFSSSIPYNGPSLVETIIDRVNTTSSLFQQPAFIADLIVLGQSSNCSYYKDMPVDYISDSKRFSSGKYLTLTLEYGHLDDATDPFNIYRSPTKGDKSVYIHPVLRYYEDGKFIEEHHVAEDLENHWNREMYTVPLLHFLERLPNIDLVETID